MRVHILKRDPDLGAALPQASFELARARCTAELIPVDASSPWPEVDEPGEEASFLVLKGALLHRLRLAGRDTVELIGPGDVVSPWPSAGDVAELLNPSRWQLLDEAELAGLDPLFVEQSRRWPELSAALAQRTERRLRSLLLRLAVAQIPQLDTRLRVVLWDLADRFGHVDRKGVLLPLRLQQAVLAGLVCASREAVGRSLSGLQRRGTVLRDQRGWRLTERPPNELFGLAAGSPPGRPSEAPASLSL